MVTLPPDVTSGGWFYAWWRGDPRPQVAVPDGFTVRRLDPDDFEILASLGGSSLGEVVARQRAGHNAYLATVRSDPVGFGWSAGRTAEIGELQLRLELPENERYLWDFFTPSAWRGQGIYPGLLQAILEQELADGAERFWIGHDADNHASARGILKAGFRPVGELWLLPGGRMAIAPQGPRERAERGAALLNLPLLDD